MPEPDAPPDVLPVTCPHCGAAAGVSQVQGDRCPGCGFEFDWFGAGEEFAARDFLDALTGEKHLVALPDESGFLVAHR